MKKGSSLTAHLEKVSFLSNVLLKAEYLLYLGLTLGYATRLKQMLQRLKGS